VMRSIKFGAVAGVILAASLMWASTASASAFTFTVGGTDAAGDPISAQANIGSASGVVSFTLTNLLANPKDVGQLLSDFSFTVSGLTGGLSIIENQSGRERTVAGNGTFTNGLSVEPNWSLSVSAGTIKLDNLAAGAAGPAHLLIGEPGAGGIYSNANGSIAGNGPHNPFLAGTVLWFLSVPGVTTDSSITNVVFSFGTTPGDNHAGTLVPEPTSLLLVGSGLAALGAWGRKRLIKS